MTTKLDAGQKHFWNLILKGADARRRELDRRVMRQF